MKVTITVRNESNDNPTTTEAEVVQEADGAYRVRGYGKTETLEGMMIRIASRHINSILCVEFRIAQFTIDLIYQSAEYTALCNFAVVLKHNGTLVSTVASDSVFYRFALKEIKAVVQKWFVWATYSFLSNDKLSHYFEDWYFKMKGFATIEAWKREVWTCEQRGGLAHQYSLEYAWLRESYILIPKLEALISEVQNGHAQTA